MAIQTKYQKDLQDGKIKPKPVVAPPTDERRFMNLRPSTPAPVRKTVPTNVGMITAPRFVSKPPASNDRGGDRIVMPARPAASMTPYRSSVGAPTFKVNAQAPAKGGGMGLLGGQKTGLSDRSIETIPDPQFQIALKYLLNNPQGTQRVPQLYNMNAIDALKEIGRTGKIKGYDLSPSQMALLKPLFGSSAVPTAGASFGAFPTQGAPAGVRPGTSSFPGRPSFPGSNTALASATTPSGSTQGGSTQGGSRTRPNYGDESDFGFGGRTAAGAGAGTRVSAEGAIAAEMEKNRLLKEAYIRSLNYQDPPPNTTTTQGPPANTTQISEMEQLAQLMQLGKYAKADPVVQPADTSQLDEMYKMYMQLMQQFGDLQNKYIQSLIDSQNKAPVAPPIPPSPVLGPEPLVPNYFAPSAQNGAYAEFNDIGMGLLNNMSPYNLQALRQMMAKLGYTGTGQMGRYGERTYARPGGSGNMRIADAAFEDPANYLGLPSGERENAEAALRFFLGQSGFSDQYAFPGRAQYPYPQQTTPPTPILA